MTGAPTRSLVFERQMPHPPEKVWRALTRGALIAEWLMQNDFVSRGGASIYVSCEAGSGLVGRHQLRGGDASTPRTCWPIAGETGRNQTAASRRW